MKCLIVDDQKAFHLIIGNLIGLDPSLTLIGSYVDAFMAHKVIVEEEIDLLFLDIEMPGMNGIELAKIIQDKGPMVIFTTSQTEYALEAFNLNVIDYLIKPIEPSRFLKAVEKAKKVAKTKDLVMSSENDEFVFIRDSYTIRRIKIADILYLEASVNYVNIHLSSGQSYSIHSSITSLEEKLPKNLFFRVHRSFIVNLGKVDTIEGKTLVVNGHMVPIADAYRTALNRRMPIL
ncbi:LytTR family DNA-binding domain-containing protein [Pedobacter sp. Hv1]|uniref:LytR/AlgR family response regulator transcription factor n=1 Tax=Pedobacter sp. Hv1 TaxID=1740090 RepID=UPI0006D8A30C|nr:LytTR family DNA-binding domain-containing protein [Pedobacter sp. Hv1]KQC01166.1 two-component system response regulator [Pedobacter sp. Hv1]